ncbi:MAG: hypothetical protein ACI398_05890 [Clostridium sp.]
MKNEENILNNEEILKSIKHSYKVLKNISEARNKKMKIRNSSKYRRYIK